ncbi:MAG: peptide chain release factor 2, partial [Firmicutes bacterium RBG_13_65_8]
RYRGLADRLENVRVLLALSSEAGGEELVSETEEAIAGLSGDVARFQLELLLNGEYDRRNALLTFHAGAGGIEAQDWVEMLMRMYMRWAERHGYQVELLSSLEGEEAGLKSATIAVRGPNAYGFLRTERGVHRLVRISPFDAQNRRHTTFASVDVTPEIEDAVELQIPDDDLRIDTYRSSGRGGQHVNKTDSAVRITHLPTGITATCQNERSQHSNKATAMRILMSRLLIVKEREMEERMAAHKGEQREIAWGSQIRSYVFHPYSLIKDHRTDIEVGNVQSVMDGDLDQFVFAFLKQEAVKGSSGTAKGTEVNSPK